LAGAELRVPESSLQPLPEGTYYLHQLVGCRVETVDGAPVGDVTRVEGGAGAAVLTVASVDGEVLVPLAQEICVGIDVGARLIRVRMPEGLLELNETKAPGAAPRSRARKSRRAGGKDSEVRCRDDLSRMIGAGLTEGVVGRGVERGLVDVRVHDLRTFTTDRHRTVDDVPYGGGPGMVMKVEPFVRAVQSIRSERGAPAAVVLLSPQGRRFDQIEARRLAGLGLVLLCGRYEDRRTGAGLVATEGCRGDFVVSSGGCRRCRDRRGEPAGAGVVGDGDSVEQVRFRSGCWIIRITRGRRTSRAPGAGYADVRATASAQVAAESGDSAHHRPASGLVEGGGARQRGPGPCRRGRRREHDARPRPAGAQRRVKEREQ
jgi:hypothetical protein